MKTDRGMWLPALKSCWNFLQGTRIVFKNLLKMKGDMIQNAWGFNIGEGGMWSFWSFLVSSSAPIGTSYLSF